MPLESAPALSVAEIASLPHHTLGTFPVRLPSPDSPADDDWHIDVSFGYETPDFMETASTHPWNWQF